MTTLPISIPDGYTVLVKKGDNVLKGDLLAKSPESSLPHEKILDLVGIYNETAAKVRKYLKKGPGDRIEEGDTLACRSRVFGLKKDCVLSHVPGTVVKFERDTGKLIIKTDKNVEDNNEEKDVISPIDGTIKVCNNDAILISPLDSEEELEDKKEKDSEISLTDAGKIGSGGKATGYILVVTPREGNSSVTSSEITKEAIDKILLLPNIEKEAVAKAAAIGVAGVLGTELTKDLFVYIKNKKIDLPVISIDGAVGKKLIKTKNKITIHGEKHSITDED